MNSCKNIYCIVFSALLFACSKSPTDTTKDNSGNFDFSETVAYSNGIFESGLEGEVTILVPEGAVPAGEKFLVKRFSVDEVPADTELVLSPVYEIAFSKTTFFEEPVTVILHYDYSDIDTSKIIHGIPGAVYYDEDLSRWVRFSDCVTDTAAKTVTIRTRHLCKIAWYSYHRILGYSDFHQTPHFTIYWVAGKPMSDATYGTKRSSEMKAGIPHYIQDMGFFLEEACSTFKSQNLAVPSGRIDVRVLPLKSDNGNSSFFGVLRINDSLRLDAHADYPTILGATCAHELLHYVQDYYYMQLFSQYTIQWWLEATAVCADKIVWPASSYSEAVNYGNDGINEQLHRSWDDVSGDPEWYTPGGFLHYLSFYRTGKKLSIPGIIKAGGDATDLSYIRTILDRVLKDSCGADSIGDEYAGYVKGAYDGTGPVTLFRQPVIEGQNFSYIIPATLRSTQSQQKILDIPYLAAKLFKCVDKTALGATLRIVVTKTEPSLRLRAYECYKSDIAFLRELVFNDTLKVNLKDSTYWIDILAINCANSGSASASFTCDIVIEPVITSVTPSGAEPGDTITLRGKNFGKDKSMSRVLHDGTLTDGMRVVSWSSDSIVWCIPEQIMDDSLKLQIRVETVLSNIFTVDINTEPVIDSIRSETAPRTILFPGETINVFGRRFSSNTGDITLKLDEISIAATSVSGSRISFKMPETASGMLPLQIYRTGANTVENSIFAGIPSELLAKTDSTMFFSGLTVTYFNPRTESESTRYLLCATGTTTLPFSYSGQTSTTSLESEKIPDVTGSLYCTYSSDHTSMDVTVNYSRSVYPNEDISLTCKGIPVKKNYLSGRSGVGCILGLNDLLQPYVESFSGNFNYVVEENVPLTGIGESGTSIPNSLTVFIPVD